MRGAGCNVTVLRQTPDSSVHSKVKRLRRVRTGQQARLRAEVEAIEARSRLDALSNTPTHASPSAGPTTAVVVVDLDEYELPPPAGLRRSIELVRSGAWDVLCANGWKHVNVSRGGVTATVRGEYDLFALVRTDGHWYGPIEDAEEQARLYQAVVSSAEPYPVRACFGGVGVYRYRGVWDGGAAGSCSYKWRPSDALIWEHYTWCEHVGFLECLRNESAEAGLRVGIFRELPVHWTSDPISAENDDEGDWADWAPAPGGTG